jgi:hypothetical protein
MPHAAGARKRLACPFQTRATLPAAGRLRGKYEFGEQNLNSTASGLINAEHPR